MKRPPIYKPKRFQQGGPVLTQDDVEDNYVMIQKLQELGVPSRDIRGLMRLPVESRLQVIDNLLRMRANASQQQPERTRTTSNSLVDRNVRARQRREQASEAQPPPASSSSSLPLPPEPPPMPARAARRQAARENMSADDLNARVLRLTRGGAPQDEVDRRLAARMGLTFAKGGLVHRKSKGKKC